VLYINGKQVASGTGGSISYRWNTRGLKPGTYTLQFVVKDAAGNTGIATTQVVK
jgi:hypothetical protein